MLLNETSKYFVVYFYKKTTAQRRVLGVRRVMEIKHVKGRKLFIVESIEGVRSFYEDAIISLHVV